MKIILYVVLMIVDIYIFGSIDFIGLKLFLLLLVNACLILFIKYAGKNKKVQKWNF